MTEKCYNLYHGVCDEMDIKSSAYCDSPNCWGTLEKCCPNHSSKSDCEKVSNECSCKCNDDEGDGAPCRNLSACSLTCEKWANTNCSSSSNNDNDRKNNDNDRKNVTGQSTTDGSGISAGAGIAIGIVSIFALVGFIALIIGGSGNKRRRTSGNRRSR